MVNNIMELPFTPQRDSDSHSEMGQARGARMHGGRARRERQTLNRQEPSPGVGSGEARPADDGSAQEAQNQDHEPAERSKVCS